MIKAVFPGSFDPITNGHLDIIMRSAKLFDEVVVLVAANASKNLMFTVDERLRMVERAVSGIEGVSVAQHDGLTAEFCLKNDASVIVRGLRDSVDFTYERELESNNTFLNKNLETVYLSSANSNVYIRSSSVKELLRYGVDVSSFVPDSVTDEIRRKKS